jgi:voltage-gated potassium channel
VIVLGIRRSDGRMLFNPTADTTVNAGDHLIVMGRQDNLRAIEGILGAASGAHT